MTDERKMPEPTGEYVKVPPGWPPQTWGAHLARIEFLEALGHPHYSRTDPKWNIKKFTSRILKEDRLRILKILREAKTFNVDVERAVLADSGL
jgi:hypothetical protein